MDKKNVTNDVAQYIKARLGDFQVKQPGIELNPKYHAFKSAGIRRAEAVAKNSVALSNEFNNSATGLFDRDNSFVSMMYSINDDKIGRLGDYRIIAASNDVSDALDEICDECINVDEHNDVVKLKIQEKDYDSRLYEMLQEEFREYIELYDLKNNGWRYFRQFLVEGELFFEHVVHKNYIKEEGVLAVVNLPADLIDPVYTNLQNTIIKGYIFRKPQFEENSARVVEYDYIPFNVNQVVYINSGLYDNDRVSVIPFIKNAQRPFRQLSLIEDAIVIYRLVRAPERLVFNVDVGNMSPPKAEAYLRKLINQYWSSKTFDVTQNAVVNKFNPQSMLDAFWFAKRQGAEGTTVNQLAGGQNLGELADLQFFQKKLYKALRVPISRLDPADSFRDGQDMLREELKFARFINRLQQRFAVGLKNGFITHLKLKEQWDSYNLKSTKIDVIFNEPTNFAELRNLQRIEARVNNYSNAINTNSIAITLAQRLILNWSEAEILANKELLRKEAEFNWEIEQIAQAGPNWRQALLPDGEGAPGEGGDIASPDSASPGTIPDFGGSPAATDEISDDFDADEPIDTPEGDVSDDDV